MIYQWKTHICFQDVDAEGIVYHANYLGYAERARTEWLFSLGLSNQGIMEHGVAIVLRHIDMDFIAPAKLDDELVVDVKLIDIKNASMIFEQTARVNGEDKVKMHLQVAYVNKDTLRPTRTPADIKEIFMNYMKGQDA